ncbi:MAG TPA: hypothetical protein VG432_14575 [Gemmatimonadaceae bacterium]|nr:hypothetical protein [Gemmatimonadaceae bacterium]
MAHAHDLDLAAAGGDARIAASNEQPTARSGPIAPEDAPGDRARFATAADPRSGLTRREHSDRWPIG